MSFDDECSLELPAAWEQSKPVKVILLGDSMVGKSKLVERFLMDGYAPQRSSTHALTLFTFMDNRYHKKVEVVFWDTAGQERFNNVHPAYYLGAHACILVFDVERKITYRNLDKWYEELNNLRPGIPVMVAANKIDLKPDIVGEEFKFAKKHNMKLFYVSASAGTNVVQMFHHAIDRGIECLMHPPAEDFVGEVADLIQELDANEAARLAVDAPPAPETSEAPTPAEAPKED